MLRAKKRSAAPRPNPDDHASVFVIPDICTTLRELAVAGAVRADDRWYLLHPVTDVTTTEAAYGMIKARWRYNAAMMRRVRQTQETVVGSHAGFFDAFVPVGPRGRVWGVLAAGPFAASRPTMADVLERWQNLTTAPAQLSNGTFARYLSLTLSTPTLEGDLVRDFVRLLELLAGVFSGQPSSLSTSAEVAKLSSRLLATRFAERMWYMGRQIIDERAMGEWLTAFTEGVQRDLGIARLPQHVAAGLLLDARADPDPVGGALRGDVFHRACVSLAMEIGNLVSGRVSDHVLAFLLDDSRSGPGPRRKLMEVMRRADALARRHGLSIHWGIAMGADARSLPMRYQAALAAAEEALSVGLPMRDAAGTKTAELGLLSGLRRELGRVARERPALLTARFDRYIDAACRGCGYRIEPVRFHFEAGLEQIANALSDVGALDERTRAELPELVGRDVAQAQTLEELASAFRRAVADVALAAGKPTEARRQWSMRRATDFIRDHLAEPLTLATVARAAGFAPAHFSRLFAKTEGTPLRSYLTRLRVQRSKQLLASTNLSVERVGQIVGFVSRTHFHRAFWRAQGMTPTQYRGTRKS